MLYLSRLRLFFVLILIVTTFYACTNSTGPEPSVDSKILSFSIEELPAAEFSDQHDQRIISISNFEALSGIPDKTGLTASFTLSEGATAYIAGTDSVLTPGEGSFDFSTGFRIEVVSEDEQSISEYFIHLEPHLPLYYYLEKSAEIVANPSGIAPLTAEISFTAPAVLNAQLTITGEEPVQKSWPGLSGEVSLPVLGLYPDTANKVVLSLNGVNRPVASDTFFVETEALPSFFPEIRIDQIQEEEMEPGMHFSELHIGNAGAFNSYPIIFDNSGTVRWYVDFSEHGRITWPLQFNEDLSFYAVHGVTLNEWDMLGNELKELIVPRNDMHHEVIKLPKGNYLIAVSKRNTPFLDDDNIERDSVEDFIIEIDGTTGEILTEWDMGEILDVDRTDIVDPNNGDWFHMNAIWYDDRDRSLIISGRNQGLVKVNWDNELQWILAPHKGWGNAGRFGEGPDTIPYLLTAVDASGTAYSADIQNGENTHPDFSWVWGQHAPMILPDGNLLVFDNGTNRNFGSSSNYSMASEYSINEENMTVERVWTYGKERGSEMFSNIISDVDLLPETGNRLFSPGYITSSPNQARITELTYPDNRVVFEATLLFKDALATGQGWGNIDISYRAERIQLYR